MRKRGVDHHQKFDLASRRTQLTASLEGDDTSVAISSQPKGPTWLGDKEQWKALGRHLLDRARHRVTTETVWSDRDQRHVRSQQLCQPWHVVSAAPEIAMKEKEWRSLAAGLKRDQG